MHNHFMNATLHTDGACLGNPGPMGLGIVLELENGKTIEKAVPAGHGTNNIAEYSALIAGLAVARKHKVTHITAYLDSELVVKQVNGEWRVKDNTLQALHAKATEYLQSFEHATVEHVRRHLNTRADALSKTAAEKVTTRS